MSSEKIVIDIAEKIELERCQEGHPGCGEIARVQSWKESTEISET